MERSDEARRLDSLYDHIGKLERLNRQLDAENKDLKSGHFCPSPQLAKLATDCNCAHSDKHRATDWASIDALEAKVDRLTDAYQKTIDDLINCSCNCLRTMKKNFEQALKGRER